MPEGTVGGALVLVPYSCSFPHAVGRVGLKKGSHQFLEASSFFKDSKVNMRIKNMDKRKLDHADHVQFQTRGFPRNCNKDLQENELSITLKWSYPIRRIWKWNSWYHHRHSSLHCLLKHNANLLVHTHLCPNKINFKVPYCIPRKNDWNIEMQRVTGLTYRMAHILPWDPPFQ